MQKEPSPTLDRTTVCNCLALRQAARHISQIYDSYLASEGLRTTQYSILAKLNRLGPLSINELAKSMVMDRPWPCHPSSGTRQVAGGRRGRGWPHTQPAAHSHRRGAAEGCDGEMAGNAEEIRIDLWRARCRRAAERATARGLHSLRGQTVFCPLLKK
jgi:hypothetical protein